jgi:hypothetical protein
MNELLYPTIDLFIYDLRSPLNASANEIAQNHQAFLNRLPPGIEFGNIEIETEYLELTTPTRIKLKPVNLRLAGYSIRYSSMILVACKLIVLSRI